MVLLIFPFVLLITVPILVILAAGVACSMDEAFEYRMKSVAEWDQPAYHETSAFPAFAVVWTLLSAVRLALHYFWPQSECTFYFVPESYLSGGSSGLMIVCAILFHNVLIGLPTAYLGVELHRMQKAGKRRDR